ncbi:52 kDa repressor of the inhibitor of the protein kinase-like [Dendronephthya gigantea]|uniref:52 kDa repressor of the inhibitor of the protein kinase-like n=1 Tax=Dendronephthya gigantea TaxID=151771 RepID=UPI00106C3E30|nr:52 kDa repressor of the inhibitor of the protein kinase-like [Dendronephthya gigantea]
MCLSDIALGSVTKEDPCAPILTEAYSNAMNHQWSSFICLLSLSSVVKRPIESYFPITPNEEKIDSLSTMFNCTIYPREIATSISDQKIHLFRCALMPMDYSKLGKVPATKNHYVALCEAKESSSKVGVRHFVMKKVSPGINISSTQVRNVTPPTKQTPPPLCSTVPVATSSAFVPAKNSSSSQPVKKKQTILDKLFPKKRKFAEESDDEDIPKPNLLSKKRVPSSLVSEHVPECSRSETSCSPNDIANFVNSNSLTDTQKYEVLCNVWVPSTNFPFPLVNGRKLFPWLTYSQKLNGAFCINCVLFGSECTGMHNTSKLQRLFKTPFTTWQVAPAKFREHSEKSPLHKAATARAAVLRSHMEQRSAPIDVMLDDMKRQQIEENRKLLRPIIGAIVLCGRQNIPLRGHRDDSSNYLSDEVNCGNFIEILKYGAMCAGKTLEELFKSTPKNMTYKSKTTQNEIIDICGDMITKKLTDEIREARFYSILADEASDCSNIEQLSIVIRFVDKQCQIREEFLGFVPCKKGVSGEAVAATIEEFLRDQNLPIDDCRGQGYDGAGNMAGRLSGVAARIQETNKKALYVHCNSHRLNLCVATCCKEQLRFDLLVKTIHEMLPTANHKRLINVCKTRWVARIDGLCVFIEVFPAIIRCLEIIRDNVGDNWNPDSVRKAVSLYSATVSFPFIVALVVVSKCLLVTQPLTVQLQESAIDAGAAREKVSALYVHLEKMRNDVDAEHDSWYKEAESMGTSVGTQPDQPRTTGRQQHRANTPADTPSQYYRRVISVPFLDHLKSEIQTRFSETNLDLMDAVYGLPKNVLIYPDWKTKFSKFLNMYMDDLPYPRFLDTELEMWAERCQMEKGPLPSKLADVLPFVDKISFPNIFTAFQIFATIPVTTCTCERSISVLRRLKTYLRSTMSESRLKA